MNNINEKEAILKNLKSLIGQTLTIYIDRPIGSVHPHHKDITYEVNYGYIKECMALDGEYQDAYLLGVDTKVFEYIGEVIAILKRENDIEDKLIIVPKGYKISDDEIKRLVDFQEKYFEFTIIRK